MKHLKTAGMGLCLSLALLASGASFAEAKGFRHNNGYHKGGVHKNHQKQKAHTRRARTNIRHLVARSRRRVGAGHLIKANGLKKIRSGELLLHMARRKKRQGLRAIAAGQQKVRLGEAMARKWRYHLGSLKKWLQMRQATRLVRDGKGMIQSGQSLLRQSRHERLLGLAKIRDGRQLVNRGEAMSRRGYHQRSRAMKLSRFAMR